MTSLVNGLGGTTGFGEGALAPGDDSSSGVIDISSLVGDGLYLNGTFFTSVFVNTNGNLTFGTSSGQYTPSVITAPAIAGTYSLPMIAPFWADVDTRATPTAGEVTAATASGTSTGANQVTYDLDATSKTFTATWNDVGYYGNQTNKLNAFQVQVVPGSLGDFTIVFRYEDINWTSGGASGGTNGVPSSAPMEAYTARAGYAAGPGDMTYELAASGNSANMLALDTTAGNTGVAGLWQFYVSRGNLTATAPVANVLQGTAVTVNYDTINGVTYGTAGNDRITGTAGSDMILGGDGDDFVSGGTGNDALYGEDGDDTLLGGDGSDALDGGSGRDLLDGGTGDDNLSGGAGDDNLSGGAGIDNLNGGVGGDRMAGGLGPDTYWVDSTNDRVVETDNRSSDANANGGQGYDVGSAVDTVKANISYTLTNFVENLELASASGNLNGGGNSLDNILTGNDGDNALTGGGGNDTIDGGAGRDTAEYSGNHAAYTVTVAGGLTTVAGSAATDGTDTLTNVERLHFADEMVAFDIGGNAGMVAKVIGAVFGADAVSNKVYVGLGLAEADGGMGYAALCELAVGATGKTSHTDIVDLLLTNVKGTVNAAEKASYVAMLDGGTSVGAVTVMLADSAQNAANIGLTGLATSGIDYLMA